MSADRDRPFVKRVTRRAALASGLAALSFAAMRPRPAFAAPRVIVVGGGPAGISAALSLRATRPDTAVTLIERDPKRFTRTAQSGMLATRPSIGIPMAQLQEFGIGVALDGVEGIDWRRHALDLFSGRRFDFDQLVLALGTEAQDEDIPGLDRRARHHMPAAWGSAVEADRLRAQIATMPADGHAVLRLPDELSHPEVAARRALWLVDQLGSAQSLTVLQASDDGALRDTVLSAVLNGSGAHRIDWRLGQGGGQVLAVDSDRRVVVTSEGEMIGDVINFVPKQGAGRLAREAGLVDPTGWCPVDARNGSLCRAGVTIVGDARANTTRTLASAMTVPSHGWDCI